jgi:hypothetical protein
MAGTYTYTQTELDAILAFSEAAIGEMGQKIARQRVLGDPPCPQTELLFYELTMYYWAIVTGWQQNDNGTTNGYTNMFDQEAFNNFIDRMRKITGSYTNAY